MKDFYIYQLFIENEKLKKTKELIVKNLYKIFK